MREQNNIDFRFSYSRISLSGFKVADIGSNKLHDGDQSGFYENQLVHRNGGGIDKETKALTLMMDGGKAEKFMDKQGYNFNPVQQTIYTETTDNIVSCGPSRSIHVMTGKVISITERSRYMDKSYKRNGKVQMTLSMSNDAYPSAHIARYKIAYTNKFIYKAA